MALSNVVRFTGRKPIAEGPHFAGRPLQEAFPAIKVRKPDQVPRRTPIMVEGVLFFLDEDDGPEGAA